MKPACFVFGAGPAPVHPPAISEQDMVIAADGGFRYTWRAGIRADVIIGDFDSLGGAHGSPSLKAGGIPGTPVVRLPQEKNETDTLAALKYGLDRGFKQFHIYGGLGGRLDHTLANIQCLVYLLDRGARGFMYDDEIAVTAIRKGIQLAPHEDGIISIFALGGPALGVNLRGLKYTLEDAALTSGFPLGVSNEFIGQPGHISAKSGDLLLIYPRGTQEY